MTYLLKSQHISFRMLRIVLGSEFIAILSQA